MRRIEDLLNFIKWQYIIRMPDGGFYERLERSIMEDNFLGEEDLKYYLYWSDMYKSYLKKYLFGNYITKEKDLERFYNFLDNKYEINKHYEFNINDNIIKLPKPKREDRLVYKTELFDLILPYLAGYPTDPNIPFHEGPYELDNINIKSNTNVLDLGANFGMFSAYASSKGANVHAFEPTLDTNDKYLHKTAELNENIKVINKAISDLEDIQNFIYNKDNAACTGLSKTKNNILSKDLEFGIVPTTTVDSYVEENNLNVDFIKADIEGAERLMLFGAKNTLKEQAPDLSLCYYHRLFDYKVLTEMIKDANPHYKIRSRWKKIYATTK